MSLTKAMVIAGDCQRKKSSRRMDGSCLSWPVNVLTTITQTGFLITSYSKQIQVTTDHNEPAKLKNNRKDK